MNSLKHFKSLESALAQSLQHLPSVEILASLNEDNIRLISEKIVAENWYGDVPLLNTIVKKLWDSPDAIPFIAHSVWCAHREAWHLLKNEKINLTHEFYQPEYLIQTKKKATIIICPMTIGTNDIILFALHALKRFQPNRKIVIYGEDMEVYCAAHPEYQELFAQNTIHGMKKILSILDEGGIFITYPDFTYKQHLTVAGTLFGIERAFSSSFLKILLKSKAVLLPMTATRLKSALQMHFYAPILYNTNEEYENLPTEIKIKILCTLISKIIEGLILKVPNQWRLLPTLSHESQDMA